MQILKQVPETIYSICNIKASSPRNEILKKNFNLGKWILERLTTVCECNLNNQVSLRNPDFCIYKKVNISKSLDVSQGNTPPPKIIVI